MHDPRKVLQSSEKERTGVCRPCGHWGPDLLPVLPWRDEQVTGSEMWNKQKRVLGDSNGEKTMHMTLWVK